jgi:hypothetical protein
MIFNYPKICQGLLVDLNERTKNILERRFGLKTKEKESLEAIGRDYGITRERVRQIERDGLARVEPKIERKQEGVFNYLQDVLKDYGSLKREDIFLNLLSPADFHNHIFFLLTAKNGFNRCKETRDMYSLWTLNNAAVDSAAQLINYFIGWFEKKRSVVSEQDLFLTYQKEIAQANPMPLKALLSCLELSKRIRLGDKSMFGLKDWPEISPKGVKDKAYLVLKKENQPLHFAKIASLINQLDNRKMVQQRTVHNELIKDQRFVLVGRGTYSLKEWGYKEGYVKDVILQTLKQAGRPLDREEILQEVLKQRMVKKNTVLLNLNNECFARDGEGRYKIAS